LTGLKNILLEWRIAYWLIVSLQVLSFCYKVCLTVNLSRFAARAVFLKLTNPYKAREPNASDSVVSYEDNKAYTDVLDLLNLRNPICNNVKVSRSRWNGVIAGTDTYCVSHLGHDTSCYNDSTLYIYSIVQQAV